VEVWQPQVWHVDRAGPQAASLAHLAIAPDDQRQTRDLLDAVVAELGPDLVDLSRAMAGLDEPTFFDFVHHDEDGARAAARALWPALAEALGEGGR
jgi:lysophospholipase L1-like esterase